MTFSGRFVLNMIRFAALQGADKRALLALTSYTEAQLYDEDMRLESPAYNAVVEQAVAQTGDAFFGLHGGESLNLSAAGIISQITQTSRTVYEALHYCCEFANLGCRALPLELHEDKNYYRLSVTPDPAWARESPIAVQHTVDGLLAFTIREFNALTVNRYYPVAIHLTIKKPVDTSEYERIFKCPIKYGQPEIAILLDKAHVNQDVVTANYDLLRVLVGYAEQKMAAIAQSQDLTAQVEQTIIGMADPEFPTIEQVARNLNMSVRSLQRKLGSEQRSFKSILEDLRKDFAQQYLQREELSIADIAWMLNYAESSAFIRSFKRWTGQTPAAYRKEKLPVKA